MFVGLVWATVALATHPVPANTGALTQQTSLVQAMNVCPAGVGDKTHGAPLAVKSCSAAHPTDPMKPQSARLRIGPQSKPINGLTTAAVIQVFCKAPSAGPPPCSDAAGDQEDVRLKGAAQDIRCVNSTSVTNKCSPANSNGGPDYTGQVVSTAQIRITDNFNGTTAAGGTTHATVQDLPFSVGVQCVATASTTIGSNCSVNTTADTVVPGAVGGGGVVKEGKKASVGIEQIQEFDTGSDGVGVDNPLNPGHCPPSCVVDPANDKMFLYEGIFIP
jgi:hypothetical protein